MTVHRTAAKRDRNEQEIVAALRAAGYSVQHLSAKGVPDLLVGAGGVNILLEIKSDASAKLTAAEAEWHRAWQGQAAVVRDATTALQAVSDALMAAQASPAAANHILALEREVNDVRQMAIEDVADAQREADEARAEAISLAHECEKLRQELAQCIENSSAHPGAWTLSDLDDEIAHMAQQATAAIENGAIVDCRKLDEATVVVCLVSDAETEHVVVFETFAHGVLVYRLGNSHFCPARVTVDQVKSALDRAITTSQDNAVVDDVQAEDHHDG